jgi:hypothetical protein
MKTPKLLMLLTVLSSIAYSALADKGVGKKNKSKVSFNIKYNTNIKSSLSFNLNSGLKYTGSLVTNKKIVGTTLLAKNLVTYQKGNTIYIIPYKQKVLAPDIKSPGYVGMKLIIRPH